MEATDNSLNEEPEDCIDTPCIKLHVHRLAERSWISAPRGLTGERLSLPQAPSEGGLSSMEAAAQAQCQRVNPPPPSSSCTV